MVELFVEIIILNGLIVFILLSLDKKSVNDIKLMIFLGGVYRLAFVFILYGLLITYQDGYAFNDDYSFHEVSSTMAKTFEEDKVLLSPHYIKYQAEKNPGYYYISTVLYYFFGSDSLVARIFNVFISLLSAILIYKIGRTVWSPEVGKLASKIFIFLPDLAFWGGLQFKDSISTFLTLILFYVLFVEKFDFSIKKIIKVLIIVVLLSFVRIEASLLILFVFVILKFNFKIIFNSIKKTLFFFTALVSLTIFIWVRKDIFLDNYMLIGLPYFLKGDFSFLSDFTLLVNHKVEIQKAGLISLGYITTIKDFWRLPIAYFFVLYTPFPPTITSPNYASNLLSILSIPWLLMVPLFFRAYINSFLNRSNREAIKAILLFVFFYASMIALFLYTFSPTRHRMEFIPFLLLIAASHNRKEFHQWVRFGVFFLLIMTFLYYIVK